MAKRIVALVLSALLALSLLGPSYAPGALKKFTTKVTIVQDDGTGFHGRVKSKNDACRVHRTVKLQHRHPGPYNPTSFATIKTVQTNNKGKWKAKVSVISGDQYRAVAPKKKLPHHKGICEKGVSKTITAT
jgi:hypothetical protein